MEKATVIQLLEKYWQAETTIAEEKMLADYFRGHEDPGPELAPYRDLFAYFGQEAQVTAGPDFGTRILERVGLSMRSEPSMRPGLTVRSGRTFRLGFIAAAASICAIVAGLMLLTPHTDEHLRTIASASHPGQTIGPTTIHDTYGDPEQALTAVRHALLIASTHLNEGRRSITGPKK